MSIEIYAANYYEITENSEIIGGVFVVRHPQHIEIIDLFVNRRFQGKGFGRSLIEKVIEDACKPLCLRCEAHGDGLPQEKLSAWYRRLGFIYKSPFHEGDEWMCKF